MIKKHSDEELLLLYKFWSEEFYAASFLNPDAATIREFRKWLKEYDRKNFYPSILEDYEVEFLEEFKKQAQEPNEDECMHGYFCGRDCHICLNDDEQDRIKRFVGKDTLEKVMRNQDLVNYRSTNNR